MMNRKIFFTIIVVPLLSMLASCTEISDVSYAEVEKRSLQAWMKSHHPELLDNFQEEGAYYVEVLDEGAADSVALVDALSETTDDDGNALGCWVLFNLTGRDLAGQVCITRDEMIARMQGTFTKFTHYVPNKRYIGTSNTTLAEGSYLALTKPLKIGDRTIQARYGTKLRLYLPSSLANSGISGDGGYEGEFSLDGTRPVILDIEITDRINNPVSYEAYMIEGFGKAHGGISPLKEVVEDEDDEADGEDEDEEEEEEEDDGMLWRPVCDTIQGLIVTKRYNPADPQWKFDYGFDFVLDADEENGVAGKTVHNEVYSDTDVYANLSALDDEINAVIAERFGEGAFDGDKIGTDGTATVWYITRLLDGFIVDSNIAEVRKLIYGAEEATDNKLTFSPESEKDKYVTAWYYAISEMRYGQWATIAATSTFAYGYSGRSGSTMTSSSGGSYYYNPYMWYNNYYNGYYGGAYMDMYYYNMYNNLMYNNLYSSTTTSETTTDISSEVQSYTPLLFQVYIEPKKK